MMRLLLLCLGIVLSAPAAWADRADRAVLSAAFDQAGIEGDPVRAKVFLIDEMIGRIADTYVEPRERSALAHAAAEAVRKLDRKASPDEAFKTAVEAMVKQLDPHTAYLSPADMEDMRSMVTGEFGGVGMELTMKDDHVTVVAPIDDTPAARAGIMAGDRITLVDGQTVQGQSLSQVVARIRGKVGTRVTLMLARPDGKPREVVLRREIIHVSAVRGRLEGDVAYVRLSQFAGGVAINLKSTLLDLDRAAGGRLGGIVLDLRRNPGGLLDQAVEVSDLFLGDVPIVATTGRRQEDRQVYSGRSGEILANVPMAVMIDGGSASASEIVAGALRDNRRAVLVGQKSFGKGSVQTLLPLSEGSLKVTTAHYLRPSTLPVDKVGLQPDIPAEGDDVQLERALKAVRGR
ncbi:S41 family peptidase [Magnetospirillum sp. UT-4]|uniref:S41 family peptidase n=1 Tax=Magnetospirillum sp. UT-4 TaxID=2681467 RepID=UPI001381414B|nr:S41 family peptidase [Magnetospirillum sp. UT-4]CAA7612656.1 putative carboxy-terminal-processing protease [Magnetospirillum sp. UT-4]